MILPRPGLLLPGVCATTAMTLSMAIERRLRPDAHVPVDYDATDHVVTAASAVFRYTPRTDRGRRALFALVHWGYGSAAGTGYGLLRRAGVSPTTSTVAFYTVCQTMAFTLFPTLGDTPPPWRWRRGVLVSSLAQHAVYAVVAGATTEAVRSRG